jgi:hypothetical protein
MKLKTIILCILIVAGVTNEGSGRTGQESGRDAIYTQFEEYDASTLQEKIRARIDAFAEHLKLNPSLRAVVISYGGKKSCRNEALLRARLLTRYLSELHGIPSNRVTTQNGGYRNDWVVELWIGSPGATRPWPANTISRKSVRVKGNCNLTPIRGT